MINTSVRWTPIYETISVLVLLLLLSSFGFTTKVLGYGNTTLDSMPGVAGTSTTQGGGSGWIWWLIGILGLFGIGWYLLMRRSTPGDSS